MDKRLAYTFRDRMAEWTLSAGMMFWGIMCIVMETLFHNSHYYLPLLNIMPQIAWGIMATAVGAIRLLFLIINGAFRPSAHIRALGCVFGCLVWGSLVIASISLGPIISPNLPIFISLLALDSLSLWFAAGDAKLADIVAKGE